MTRRIGTAALALAALVVAGVRAQQAQAPQTPPVVRASVDYVAVDARVVDGKGRPVTDLTADDFELIEDGQPQKIDTFYLLTSNRTLLAAARLPAAPTTDATAAASTPDIRPLPDRVFVFVLDMSHLSAAGFTRSRKALESFLATGLQPTDIVGVVANGKMLGNRLSNDHQMLLKELGSVEMPNLTRFNEMRTFPRIIDEEEALLIGRNDQRTVDRVVARGCAEDPGQCSGPAFDEPVRVEVENKGRRLAAEIARDSQAMLTELGALANGLGRFPGPKQVVILSDGFSTLDLESALQQITGLAARNRVVFSTIDARGLARDPRMQSILTSDAPLTSSSGDFAVLGADSDADVLTSLALDTGGHRIFNMNDVRPGLDEIATDAGTYYVLGYKPTRALDGSYRHLQVKVKRPGLTVRARRGYLATREAVTPDEPEAAPPPAVVPAEPPATRVGPVAPAAAPPPPPSPENARRPGSVDRIGELVSADRARAAGSAAEAEKLARQGWEHYSRGDVEGAQSALASATRTGHAPTWAYYALGQAEFALQHTEQAIAAWQRVRREQADYEPVYFDLADGYLVLGRVGDAVDVLREASTRWPDDSETHNALGVVLVKRGAIDDAIKEFEQATRVAPDDGLGFFNLGRAYQLRYQRTMRSAGQTLNTPSGIGEPDRQRAIAALRRYVEIGGPFLAQAKDALAALQWR